MRTRSDSNSLIGQVVATNVLLVVATLFAASAAASLDLEMDDQRTQFALLALSIVLVLLVNMLMLRRRFSPLERLIERVEAIDPANPAAFEAPDEAGRSRRSTASPRRSAACSAASTPSASAAAGSRCAPRRRSAGASRATCTTR